MRHHHPLRGAGWSGARKAGSITGGANSVIRDLADFDEGLLLSLVVQAFDDHKHAVRNPRLEYG